MEYEKQEELEKWLEELSELPYGENSFEKLENPPHENQDIAAIIFLYGKIKKEHRPEKWFLHGEHDQIYIGSSFDIFEDFTYEEAKMLDALGVCVSDVDGGFMIFASM